MKTNSDRMLSSLSTVADQREAGDLPHALDEETPVITGRVEGADAAQLCADNYASLHKAIRTSSWWLLGWTVFSLFDKNISWAIVLAAVSVMSFIFYDAASMFVVYAGVMLWAAVWNIFLSSDATWMVMGIVQVAFALFSINEYRKYRKVKAEYASANLERPSGLNNRESRLAWLALFLGAIILVGLIGFIPAVVAVEFIDDAGFTNLVDTMLIVIMELATLGFPVGIAALISGSRPKAAAAAGIALGTLSATLSILNVVLAATP